jgi:hypothetical protein
LRLIPAFRPKKFEYRYISCLPALIPFENNDVSLTSNVIGDDEPLKAINLNNVVALIVFVTKLLVKRVVPLTVPPLKKSQVMPNSHQKWF